MRRKDFHRALRFLGIGQNELARRIGIESGHFGRVVRKDLTSAPVWRRLRIYLKSVGFQEVGDGHAA